MSELDKLLDTVMKAKADRIDGLVSDMDRQELIEALKEKKKAEIIQEISQDIKQKLKNEVDVEVAQELNRKRLKELTELMWSGFILAFIVGLIVNQVTDIIGYYKGSVTLESLYPTIIVTFILLFVCFCGYLYSFLKRVLFIIDEKKDR